MSGDTVSRQQLEAERTAFTEITAQLIRDHAREVAKLHQEHAKQLTAAEKVAAEKLSQKARQAVQQFAAGFAAHRFLDPREAIDGVFKAVDAALRED